MGAAHTLDYHDTCPSDEPPSGFSRFSSSFARPGRVLSTEPSMTLMATPQPGVHLSTCPMAVGMVRTALAVPLSRTRRWPLTEHGRLQHTIRAKTTWTLHSHLQVRNFLALPVVSEIQLSRCRYVVILANENGLPGGITSNTACNFTLDHLVGKYTSPQPNENTREYQYNITGYSTDQLSNDTHTMIISTNHYASSGYLNFDYAIYTYVYSVVTSSAHGSNINLGLMNPITIPHRLQDIHPPAQRPTKRWGSSSAVFLGAWRSLRYLQP